MAHAPFLKPIDRQPARLKIKVIHLTAIFCAVSAYAANTAPTSSPLNDGKIAAIMKAIDLSEVDAAELAVGSKNASIRDFAVHMVKDHGKDAQKTDRLVIRLEIRPEDSALLKQFEADGALALDKLKRASGLDFDRLYVHQQVADHEKVLDTIDRQLIPGAQSQELRSQLKQTRKVLEDHLKHARKLERDMG